MAHGNSRICICYKYNMYGMIPRFSSDICPNCRNKAEQITKEELRRKLNLSILYSPPLSFIWRKLT